MQRRGRPGRRRKASRRGRTSLRWRWRRRGLLRQLLLPLQLQSLRWRWRRRGRRWRRRGRDRRRGGDGGGICACGRRGQACCVG